VALIADLLLQVFIEIVGMAHDALIVPRPLQRNRAVFNRDVAQIAFEGAIQLLFVKSVNEKILLRKQRLRNQGQRQQRQEGEKESAH
jgi:hypothetical protein